MVRRAVGSRGSWFASIDGEAFPCIHTYWYKAGQYDDPHYVAGDSKWEELVEAIRSKGQVILTKDEAIDDGMGFNRTGYVGLFEVGEVAIEGTHLRFPLTRRIESLAR